MRGRVLGLVAGCVLAACGARAQSLTADLSSHLVALTTGFSGTSVVLFGATDGQGDVVAVVRGPERTMAVRRKSRVAGIWVNTRQIAFSNVPSFYAIFANRPIADLAPASVRALHQFGMDNLRFSDGAGARSPAERETFRTALIEDLRRQGLYSRDAGRVTFLGNRLFRATIDFPSNMPSGTYIVEVYLLRDRSVVSAQTTPLVVLPGGVDATVADFAQRQGLAYGVLAVSIAAMAGWLASLPFRNA